MPKSWPADLLTLMRWRNVLLSAAGVAIGGALAQSHVVFPAVLEWAMASAALLAVAGNVANDVADRDTDRISHPDRPLVSGGVSTRVALAFGGLAGGLGLASALWVSSQLFAIAVAALVVMLVYSPLLKRFGLLGNVAVAVVASLPLVYGASAVGWWRAGLAPAAMGALLHLARELVKDVEDEAGDRAAGRLTLPVTRGTRFTLVAAAVALAVFVPVTLAPWLAGWYGRRYAAVVLPLDLGVVLLIPRLLAGESAGVRPLLKAAMALGLLALLWDRL